VFWVSVCFDTQVVGNVSEVSEPPKLPHGLPMASFGEGQNRDAFNWDSPENVEKSYGVLIPTPTTVQHGE
jgi:hypothetical protein